MTTISRKALALILKNEGFDQPSKWPGHESGITLPIGYDLGYVTPEEFARDWKEHFKEREFNRLLFAVGKKGLAARDIAENYWRINVSREAAEKVFAKTTIPRYVERTRKVFPGFERLPFDAQGALVSLVFNRGTRLHDKDPIGLQERREMRAVRAAVALCNLPEIARQIRSMKRLWEGKGVDGLITRREEEAKLVESCIGK